VKEGERISPNNSYNKWWRDGQSLLVTLWNMEKVWSKLSHQLLEKDLRDKESSPSNSRSRR